MGSRPDKRFGRYEVLSEIGRGAMGAVYKARDPKINRFVAIKAISAISQTPDEEQDYRKRFFNEAQAAGRLVHPGIVTIYDVGEENDTRTPYIVMEFVGGQSLSGLLSSETNKLPLDQALKLAEEIALALACAHEQGVVHRDIKPANILLSGDGHAKIADFGIAKLNLSNVTLPGHALGTPAYMSPEQVDGRPVDGRSDLFSLGVMLYNMVTGHKPFQGNSAVTVCYKVANWNPLPATSFDLALPPELDTLINRAIAKEPSQRYQTGAEFASEVRSLRLRLSGQEQTPAAAPTVPKIQIAPPPPIVSETTRKTSAPTQTVPAALSRSLSSNLSMLAAACVLAVGVVVVIFGVPFHHRTQAAVPVVTLTPAPRKSQAMLSLEQASKEPAPIDNSADISPITPPVSKVKPSPKAPVKVTRGMKSPAPSGLQPLQNANATPPVPTPVALGTVHLKIQIQHHFASGKLTLWVDDKQAFSAELHGEAKRRLAVFHGIDGSDFGEVSVSAGSHSLRVTGQSSDNQFDESKTISSDFSAGGDKVLKVTFDKNNREMRVLLQ
jgi:eukaryotic-like serine/threonine-protein kinase